ncbi:MAG: hypothetical protein IKT97_04325 [Spirochaetia bacterium]|nr:hypothetical protein [Spirochaetia bacterium]
MEKITISVEGISSATFISPKINNITNGIKALKFVIKENLIDSADIQLVINDTNEINVWTGKCDELLSLDIFSTAEKVFLILFAGLSCTAESFNNVLQAIHNKLPSNTLFLYSIINDDTVKTWNYVIFSQASIIK